MSADQMAWTLALVRQFVDISDLGDAARFADEHAELRDPIVVWRLLADSYDPESLEQQRRAIRLGELAAVLCGTADTSTPMQIATFIAAANRFHEAPTASLGHHALDLGRELIQAPGFSDLHTVMQRRVLAEQAACCFLASQQLADLERLNEAVRLQRRAIALTPGDAPEYTRYLSDLASQLSELYSESGDRATIQEAVDLQRRAVALTAEDGPEYAGYLSSLASHLSELYSTSGDLATIEEVAEIQRRAVSLTSPDSPELPSHLNNLANRLAALFVRTGDQATLEDAVETQRKAVATSSDSDPATSRRLRNLAVHLGSLHELTRAPGLLQEMQSVQDRAAETNERFQFDRRRRLGGLLGGRHRTNRTPLVADLLKEGAAVSPVAQENLGANTAGWDIVHNNGVLEYELRVVELPGMLTLGATIGELTRPPGASFREALGRASEEINFVSIRCHDRRVTVTREVLTDGRRREDLLLEFEVFDQGVVESFSALLDLAGTHGEEVF